MWLTVNKPFYSLHYGTSTTSNSKLLKIRFWVLLKILSIYIFPWFSIELRPSRAVTILVRFLWLVHRRSSRPVCSMPVDWERIDDTGRFCVFQYSKNWFYFIYFRPAAFSMRMAEYSCSPSTVLIVASKFSSNSSNFYNSKNFRIF